MDCLDYMKGCKDNQFDLSITDPPYGIGDFSHSNKRSKHSKKRFSWNDNIPTKEYFEELFRVSKNQIIWGGNYYTKYLAPTNYLIVWDKCMGDPIKTKQSCGEIAWTSIHVNVNIFRYPWAAGFYRKKKEQIIHPCQKPVDLAKWTLKNYAKTGDKILDTHVGSGYMRIACEDMGFYFKGTENDPDYWQAQEDRYRDHLAKGKELFEKEEYQQLIFEERG